MITRRGFLLSSAVAAVACLPKSTTVQPLPGSVMTARLRPGGSDTGYDPWLEIDAAAFRHNVREVSRLAAGRPILAVVKNNAYGLGDTLVGPLLASCTEVSGIACTRPAEALAMRSAGVRKPLLILSEVAEDEALELVANDVTLSCWLPDSAMRLEQLSRRMGRSIPVQLFIDTGLNREGMPYRRALPWIEDISGRRAIRVVGTYHMFVHDLEYDRVQHIRFLDLVATAQARGLNLGILHAAPSFELFSFPESHLDMVRVANAIFGNYPLPTMRAQADLKPVFRLKARVTRIEQMPAGDSAGFRRGFLPPQPTWIALLPVGHTDGYPITAAGTCQVLINNRLYPVVSGGVASAHTIVDVGPQKQVDIGDTATLIGADHPAIDPMTVAGNAGIPLQQVITKFSALLPRRLTQVSPASEEL